MSLNMMMIIIIIFIIIIIIIDDDEESQSGMFYELGLSTMDYLLTPPAIRANMMSPACQVVIIIVIVIVIIIVITVITILTGVSNSDLLPIPHRVFDRYPCV